MLAQKASLLILPWRNQQKHNSLPFERGPAATHLYDSGPASIVCSGRSVEHAVTVRRPLDVTQPARPVWVTHQVGVESDRVIDGIACRELDSIHKVIMTPKVHINTYI